MAGNPLSNPIDDYIAQQATASRTNANAARTDIERQRQAQQAAVAAQSGTQEWWSPANILDKFWMDDFQKGPFSSDPNAKVSPLGIDMPLPGVAGVQSAWQQGVGDKVNAATTGITKGYDTLNQGLSWGLSAMPAGMATLDWDTAGKISVGQAAMADSARRQDVNPFNAAYNTVASPVQNIATGAVRLFDKSNPLNDPNFDVTQAGQRDAAFGNSILGRVSSGATDAAVSWFLDPLVVAGKGVKIFRFGSEMMGLRGVTNMQVTTPNVARWAASKVDSTLTKLDTGVELSRDEKRISSMADNIVKMRRGELENYYLFKDKSNPYRGDLVGVADQIDNKHDALVFIGAAMGDSKYIERLRVEQHAAFDALARAKSVSQANESYWLNVPGWMAPVIHANALESNVNAGALIDDLTRRDSALRAALGVVDDAGGTPLLTSFGGRSVMGERIAGAWAAGKAHRDVRFLDRKGKLPEGQAPEDIALTWDGRSIPANDVNVDRMLQEQRISAQEAARIRRSATWFDETGPAGYEQVFQLSAGFRRVRLWSWINGQHASGYMHVRGSLVGTESLDELNAALSDAKTLKVDQSFVQGAKDVWNAAMRSGSPEARIEAVRNIERMAASRLAKQFGVDEDEMLQVYDVLDARRSQLLGTMKPRDGKGRAYGIDPEDNSTILLDPLLQSQLDIKIPMLDMRQLERTAKIMARPEYKGALQRGVAKDIGTNMLDEIAALWKASVLLRLGYTTRNVAEGWMRSWAVLGTMPGLAATGRLARNTAYRNRAYSKSTRLAKKFAERELEVEKGLTANGSAAHVLREELARASAEARAKAQASAGVKWAEDSTYPVYRVDPKDPGIDWDKPQGLYTSQVADSSASPHFSYIAEDAGGAERVVEFKGRVPRSSVFDVKPSTIDMDGLRGSTRMGAPTAAEADAGVGYVISHMGNGSEWIAAARNGSGRKMTDKFREMLGTFDGTVDWDKYYDNYERLMAVGGIQARRDGHKAIRMVDESKYGGDDLTEIVLLDRSALGAASPAEPPRSLIDEHLAADTSHQALVAQIEGDLEQLGKEAQSLTNRLGYLSDARVKFGKRKVNDRGAFTGQNAQMYRDLASNQQTVDTALRSRWAREAEQELDDTKWVKVQPTEAQYSSELANAVKEMRNDQVAVMALEGADPTEMAAWIRSESGRSYRREMRLSRAGAEAKAVQVHDLVHSYLPTEAARSLAARGARKGRNTLPEGDALVAAIGDPSLLVPVHGRVVKSAIERVGSLTANQFVHAPINLAFKWIGTIPETTLVRQPFYNTVWQRRVEQLTQIAKEQGKELDDRLVASIEKNAHAYALTATNNTIYTITRYSNPAHLLRFVIPFFPAWENSMRVWLGIIARDPSVAARASMLWNLPNSLGMVVDKDGNKVSSDRLGFLNGSPNQYVVMPQFFASAMQKVADSPLGNVPVLGEAARGYSQFGLKSAKGSFNVVAPGTSPWLPGFGPLVVAPVGYVLHDKPDTQAFLRRFLGDQVYQQIVPFGEASGNPLDAFLPPAAKKLLQLKQGEDNQDYLAVVDAMMQQEMVTWYKSGGDPATKPTLDEVRDKANNFYKFSILASLTLPMSVTRMSAYQPMVDKWNALKADPSMSYQQKIDAFTQKYGDEYLPLTVSTSRSLARDLDPTLETYDALSSNTSLVEQLAQLGPETVGIIGASAPPGQFDQGVYNYYLNSDLPGLPGEAIKAHPTAGGMQTQVESAAMWRAYNEGKARRDDALKQRGGLSIDAKVNEDIKAQWRYFTDTAMVQKYGSAWSVAYNDYGSNQGKYLEGVVTVLNDPKFTSSKWGQSDLWSTVRTYMGLREKAQDAISQGASAELVNDQWEAVQEQMRYTSLAFSDFFDSYLANDKLTIGVSPVDG